MAGVSNQRMHYIDVQNCQRTSLIKIKKTDNLGQIVFSSTQESHWAPFVSREEEILKTSSPKEYSCDCGTQLVNDGNN